MRGLTMELYSTNGVSADRMETPVKQSVRVDRLIADSNGIKIDRTNFRVAEKEGAEEINDVVFPATHVDPLLQAGDVSLYWETPDGFYIERCDSKVGRLTEGADHGYYVFDGVRYEDVGGVTKYHLAQANRPGQFLEAARTLGLLGQVDAIAWTVGDYQLAGFSNIDSVAVLSQGIKAASTALNTAGVSAESLAALNAQISASNAVLANKSSTGSDLDRAFYELALAVDTLSYKPLIAAFGHKKAAIKKRRSAAELNSAAGRLFICIINLLELHSRRLPRTAAPPERA